MTETRLPGPPPAPPITSGTEFLLLVFRTFGGFAILFSCLVLLLRRAPWQLSAIDAVYWLVVGLLWHLNARAARTAGTLPQWRRLRRRALGLVLLLWVLAHSVHPIPS